MVTLVDMKLTINKIDDQYLERVVTRVSDGTEIMRTKPEYYFKDGNVIINNQDVLDFIEQMNNNNTLNIVEVENNFDV